MFLVYLVYLSLCLYLWWYLIFLELLYSENYCLLSFQNVEKVRKFQAFLYLFLHSIYMFLFSLMFEILNFSFDTLHIPLWQYSNTPHRVLFHNLIYFHVFYIGMCNLSSFYCTFCIHQ